MLMLTVLRFLPVGAPEPAPAVLASLPPEDAGLEAVLPDVREESQKNNANTMAIIVQIM